MRQQCLKALKEALIDRGRIGGAMEGEERHFLPRFLWFWSAPILLAVFYLIRYLDVQFYLQWIEGEQGVLENLTPLFLLPAIFSGILLWRYRNALPARWIMAWFLLHAAGAFYFAGEEISWGQQYFFWATPDSIAALNDQGETNLHNMSSWFDQKPRILLWLWALIGGFFIPLLVARGRLQRGGPQSWRYWIYPPSSCMVVGLLSFLVRIPEDVASALGTVPPFPFDIRASELQELLLSMFLSFYLVSVYRRAADLSGYSLKK
ncbi:MAG: hypothetical protein ACOY17_09460 [Pseudomonadota bacterium]